MVTEPLDRSIISYMHHQLIILDEETDAATAVKLMHDKKLKQSLSRIKMMNMSALLPTAIF